MEKLWQEKLTRHRCTPFNWYRDRSQTFFDKYFCLVAAFLVFYKQISSQIFPVAWLKFSQDHLRGSITNFENTLCVSSGRWKPFLTLQFGRVNLSTQVAKCKIKVTTKRHLECEAKSFVQVVHKFWCICFSKEIHGSFTRFEVTFENWLIASI